MAAMVRDVVELHRRGGDALAGAERVEERRVELARVRRNSLQAAPLAPLPGRKAAYRGGEQLRAAPRRQLAADQLPRAPQPVVAARAAQGAVLPRQAQAALERQRAAVGQEGAEALAEPVQVLRADLAAGNALRAFELLLQQPAFVGLRSGRDSGDFAGNFEHPLFLLLYLKLPCRSASVAYQMIGSGRLTAGAAHAPLAPPACDCVRATCRRCDLNATSRCRPRSRAAPRSPSS